MAAPENGFTIDGVIYEVPVVFTFDMDEAQLLWDKCGLTLGDFVETPEDEEEDIERRQQHFRNPSFVRVLMQVAYQRAHPDLNAARVDRLIGRSVLLDAIATMKKVEEAHVPLERTSTPADRSESDSEDSSESSGTPSRSDSDVQDELLESTGTGRSGTSSPEFDPTMSAA